MVKNMIKRSLSFLLVMLMLITYVPEVALAANVNTGDSNLAADSAGDATWTYSNNAIQGSVAPNATSGCTGTTYTAKEGTLTFTNRSGENALLSFDYAIELAGGAVEVDGTGVTAGASFSKTLAANDTLVIKLTSNASSEAATTITISNIKLTMQKDVTITFKAPTSGTYTVDATDVTSDQSITKPNTERFTLVATPASGYKFVGWYNVWEDSYFSMDANASLSFIDDATVEPKFVKSDTPVFQVGQKLYTNLNDAINYAVSNNIAKIALVSNGTLPAGTYTIPSGKVLVIPYDDAQTVYTTEPDVVYASHVNPSAFRTLTMAKNAKIVIANGGALSVPSKLCANGTNAGSWNGTPTGKHGRITMKDGSSIDVQTGGGLYVYGYISGAGTITARDQSTVYECFQIRCWRGGTATSGMANNSQKVFPLTQYYVQNIEVPITFYPGATEHVYTAVNMSSQAFVASAIFIGNGGMFNVDSGSLTKSFTGATDRLRLDVDGNFRVTPMSLRITGLPMIGTLDLNTSDYILPINSNITVAINSGATSLNQDAAFLPGSEVLIANGASLSVASGHKAYIYDQSEWGAYAAAGQQLVPVGYSTVNGTSAKRTAADLVDAKFDVNGTLTIDGALYTTENGAAIISSEATGKVLMNSAPGAETKTYQVTQSGSSISYAEIPITPAKLQNTDNSYYETAGKPAGTEVPYVVDAWAKEVENYTVTFNMNGHGEAVDPLEDIAGGSLIEAPEAPAVDSIVEETNEGVVSKYRFDGWYKDEACTEAWDFAADKISENTTIYAKWTQLFTVTWKNHDGSILEKDENVPDGTTASYDGEEPVKAETVQYTYEFSGWDPQIGPITSDTIYTAQFTGTIRNYTIKFVKDGVELSSKVYPFGTAADDIERPEAPAKDADAQYTYTFAGWYPEISSVSGDATYEATYSNTVNTYKVKWKNEDGSILEQDDSVAYGDMPEYNGSTPEKAADQLYASYQFTGWYPAVTSVVGNAEYTATFAGVEREFEVRFEANAPTGVSITGTMAPQSVKTVTPSNLNANSFKANPETDSCVFVGWNTRADGSGDSYADQASVTFTHDVVLYAQWDVREYRIVWMNDDGSELKSEMVPYGVMPSYSGTPTKAPDAQYTYTFAGWSPEVRAVSGEATYTATYTSTINSYLITFIDEDGTTLYSANVPYGEVPVYAGNEPVKEGDAQFSYSFAGWDPAIKAVDGTATYTATYTETTNSYTVIWNNDDGSELERDEAVLYGSMPSYDGAEPEKAETAEYEYVFDGWTPDVSAVSGNVTYTAKFRAEKRSYEIVFVDEDGSTVLDSKNVLFGEVPVYEGAEPSKERTPEYSYAFAGWAPEIKAVDGPARYQATYSATRNKYTITWYNDDGTTILATTETEYGEVPEYVGMTPVKEQTAEFTYTVAGWQYDAVNAQGESEIIKVRNDSGESLPVVHGPACYTAFYDNFRRSYTITWLNDDDSLIETTTVEYGSMPAHADVSKESTPEFSYEFMGWSPEMHPVIGPEIYKAQFNATRRSYTITWQDENGNVIGSDVLEFGQMPAHVDLEKQADAQYTYEFLGWVPAIAPVSGPATYKASFRNIVNNYTVIWKDADGRVLETDENVPYGTIPSYDGSEPRKEGSAQYTYNFIGWDKPLEGIVGTTVFVAQYESVVNKYMIKFVDDKGAVLQSSELEYGVMPVFEGEEPSKPMTADKVFTFVGWDPAVEEVTGEQTYQAVFREEQRKYTITWKLDKDTVIDTALVAYGEIPSHSDPVKDSNAQYDYTFVEWTPEIIPVKADATYTATFSSEIRSYVVSFLDNEGHASEQTLQYGEYVTLPDGPVKENEVDTIYVFVGWRMAGEPEKLYQPGERVMVTKAMSFTPEYTSYQRTYNVALTIHSNGDPSQAYTYRIESADGDVLAEVAVMGGNSVTVYGLAIETTYRVVEENSWTWRAVEQETVKTISTGDELFYSVSFDSSMSLIESWLSSFAMFLKARP